MAKTKETIEKIVAQAKESVKVLEALQKEGMARAKSMVHIPTKDEATEKFIGALKKMGLATRDDVRALERKIEELASELRTQMSKMSGGGGKKTSAKKDGAEPEASA